MTFKLFFPAFLLIAITAHSEPIMVATVNSVPVYVRHSQLDGTKNDQLISDAIEGELAVQCEPLFGISSGTETLRSELERKISEEYPNREDFHRELKNEGMTYEDYVYEWRRISALATFKAWILEYIKLGEARSEGKKTSIDEIKAAFSKEERSPEYRKKTWEKFIQDQKAKAQIVIIKNS